jgi:hypothetical protein
MFDNCDREVLRINKYKEDIEVLSINTQFIFIEWYENKYFMIGGTHEWNIIFIPQDENKSCIHRKKREFSVYYIHFSLFDIWNLKDFPFNFVHWQNLKERGLARHRWKYGKWKYAFYFINISQYLIYMYKIKYNIWITEKALWYDLSRLFLSHLSF